MDETAPQRAKRKYNSMQKRKKPQVPSSPPSIEPPSLAFINTRIPAHIIDIHFIIMLADGKHTCIPPAHCHISNWSPSFRFWIVRFNALSDKRPIMASHCIQNSIQDTDTYKTRMLF
jgi:hypothetical protein